MIKNLKSYYQTFFDQENISTESLNILKASWLETPLGPMIAIADKDKLYLLEFMDCSALEYEIKRLKARLNAILAPGTTPPLKLIAEELNAYFSGSLKEFTTPLDFLGSDFQTSVWKALRTIPYSKTCSYADLAKTIGKPSAFRAVANANGANQLAIIIPCHRVINTGGKLGGYGGGLSRKKWLINHEKQRL